MFRLNEVSVLYKDNVKIVYYLRLAEWRCCWYANVQLMCEVLSGQCHETGLGMRVSEVRKHTQSINNKQHQQRHANIK